MNRVSTTKRTAVIAALVEGTSINATCRIAGVAKHTAAAAEPPLTVWAANAPLARTPCPGWTVRNGVIEVCGQYHRMVLVPGNPSRCPDRDVCVGRKKRWSEHGLILGGPHQLGHRFPCPCDGWVLRNVTSVCGRAWRTDVIQECGQLSCPDRAECLRRKSRWSDAGLIHGDRHEMKHVLPKTASTVVLRCQDWVITPDGKIGICGNEFIPRKRPSQKDLDHGRDAQYGPCHPKGRNKERWERYGLHLNESVRRTCDYRKCERGEGGTRKTFDRVKRSQNGKYYCPGKPSHHDAENNARKIDRAEIRGAAATAKELWRPPDLADWESDQQVIGNVLLSTKDYMPNKELGRRLDDCSLACPYGDAGWERILAASKLRSAEARKDASAAAKYVSDVRGKVGRPGKSSSRMSQNPASGLLT